MNRGGVLFLLLTGCAAFGADDQMLATKIGEVSAEIFIPGDAPVLRGLYVHAANYKLKPDDRWLNPADKSVPMLFTLGAIPDDARPFPAGGRRLRRGLNSKATGCNRRGSRAVGSPRCGEVRAEDGKVKVGGQTLWFDGKNLVLAKP